MLASLILGACAGADTENDSDTFGTRVSVTGGAYTDVTVQELRSMLAEKDFALINVHIPFEGDLPDTDLSIPYNRITEHLDQFPARDAKIVLYCRSGRMSTEAAGVLVRHGYTNLYHLKGGFIAWTRAGLPLHGVFR